LKALGFLLGALAVSAAATAAPNWNFMVAGDSRNCGDVIMPAIAAAAHDKHSAFYWHLGDLRAIAGMDQDYVTLHPEATMSSYLADAWGDFKRSQIAPFDPTPFFLGIGNHETVAPKSRQEFIVTFNDWLDAEPIRAQRLKDDPADHSVRAYYHWVQGGIDFIYLDNATPDDFDAAQMSWLKNLLLRDAKDASLRAVVVGMHEALPESLARGHSMSDYPPGEDSGLTVYRELLAVKRSKPVYVLASHSHFVMQGIFDTPYWRTHGGVLDGWIVGTAGAFRYALPPLAHSAKFAKTHVYGYLVASVAPEGTHRADPVHFEFEEISEEKIPKDVASKYGAPLVHACFAGNAETPN
jgi:hypothetical protein